MKQALAIVGTTTTTTTKNETEKITMKQKKKFIVGLGKIGSFNSFVCLLFLCKMFLWENLYIGFLFLKRKRWQCNGKS